MEEKFALGFAGEDSYFWWWWNKNKKTKSGAYPVAHLWHKSQSDNKANKKLRKEYTLPLFENLKRNNVQPNKDSEDWQRPEMRKNIEIFKEGE